MPRKEFFVFAFLACLEGVLFLQSPLKGNGQTERDSGQLNGEAGPAQDVEI